MSIWRVLVLLCVAASAISMTVVLSRGGQAGSLDHRRVGFPFDTLEDVRLDSVGGPLRDVTVLLSRENYNGYNLDRLFRFYSAKYPDPRERVHVKVFTDVENRTRALSKPMCVLRIDPITKTYIGEKPESRLVFYDAVFYREAWGAAAGAGDCEWYVYSLDLDKPNQTQRVILNECNR
jgi:hypothetical protein